MAANSVVSHGIWRTFKLINAFVYVHEDQMKNECTRVVKTLYSYILDAQGKLTLQLVVGCDRKSNSFKCLCFFLVTCKNEKDPFRDGHNRSFIVSLCGDYQTLKGSWGISSATQPKLACSFAMYIVLANSATTLDSPVLHFNGKKKFTPQSGVGSAWNSNSSQLLWLSWLPARMKKIKAKIKALEWSQHYPSFLRRSTAANYIVGDGIWLKFKLIQAFMVIEWRSSILNEGAGVITTFLPFQVNGNFSRRSREANSTVPGLILRNFKTT